MDSSEWLLTIVTGGLMVGTTLGLAAYHPTIAKYLVFLIVSGWCVYVIGLILSMLGLSLPALLEAVGRVRDLGLRGLWTSRRLAPWNRAVANDMAAATEAADPRTARWMQSLLDPRKDATEAIRGLAALGEAAVPPLCCALISRSVRVRLRAGEALIRLGNPTDLEACRSKLDDEDELRPHVVAALARIGEPTVEPLCGVLRAVLNSPYWLGRVAEPAVEALGALGDRRAVQPLLELLHNCLWELRPRVVDALVEIGDEAAVGALRRQLLNDTAGTASNTALALARIGGTEAVNILREALTAGDYSTRCHAAEALGELADPATVEDLIMAATESRGIRAPAVQALSRIEDDRATAFLLDLLDSEDAIHDSRQTLIAAASAVSRTGSQPETMRGRVLFALATGELESIAGSADEALPVFVAALRAFDSGLREAAAEALGELGWRAALGPLRGRLRESSGEFEEQVRDAVRSAIRRIEAGTAGTSRYPRGTPAEVPVAAGIPRAAQDAPSVELRPRGD